MTNHEKLEQITGISQPVETEAVEMLLGKIDNDLETGVYEKNKEMYLDLYKRQLNWLKARKRIRYLPIGSIYITRNLETSRHPVLQPAPAGRKEGI